MTTTTRFKLARLLAGIALLVAAAMSLTVGVAGATGWTSVNGAWGTFPYQGAVFAETNDPGQNQLIGFARMANGSLWGPYYFNAGGTGTGASLADQGAVIVSGDHSWVFAVDAGSNQISVFHLTASGPVLTDVEDSGGMMPVSLTQSGRLLYVLNAGGDGNISGFRVNPVGKLIAIPHSSQPLSSTGAGAAQIQFSADGGWLVVTQKATSMIDTYQVDSNGRAGSPMSQASSGSTPYGFGIDWSNHVVVSEAGPGAVSSYQLTANGMLDVVTASTPTGSPTPLGAPCWIAFAGPNGQYAYTADAHSNAVTGYSVAADGSLTILNTDGMTGTTGTAPTDLATSGHGKYLYARNGDGSITAFMVMPNGQLGSIASGVGLNALPMTTVGLAGF